MMLLKVLDATEHLATGASKDAEYITDNIIPVIRSLSNPLSLILIVCDGSSDLAKFRSLIEAVFPWIISIWCISHIINRIMAEIGDIGHVRELIRKGKVIVDTFGSSMHFEHSLFETKCQEIFHSRRFLIRYVATRSGLLFILNLDILIRRICMGYSIFSLALYLLR